MFKGQCYILQTTRQNWTDAQLVCEGEAANLISIHDNEVNIWIKNLLKGEHVFIGGYEVLPYPSKTWAWIDNSTWDYESWEAGQPNQNGNEHCLLSYTSGNWHDYPCAWQKSFICMKPCVCPV